LGRRNTKHPEFARAVGLVRVGPSTNLTAGVNALNFWNGTNAVAGITYFTPNATTPVSLGLGYVESDVEARPDGRGSDQHSARIAGRAL